PAAAELDPDALAAESVVRGPRGEMSKLVHSIWLGGPLTGTGLRGAIRRNVERIGKLDGKAGKFQAVVWTDIPRSRFERALSSSPVLKDDQLAEIRDMAEWAQKNDVLLVNLDEVFHDGAPGKLQEFTDMERAKRSRPGYGSASDILRLEIMRRFGGVYSDGDNTVKSLDSAVRAAQSEHGYTLYGVRLKDFRRRAKQDSPAERAADVLLRPAQHLLDSLRPGRRFADVVPAENSDEDYGSDSSEDDTRWNQNNSAMAMVKGNPYPDAYLDAIRDRYRKTQAKLYGGTYTTARYHFERDFGFRRRNSTILRTGPDLLDAAAKNLGLGGDRAGLPSEQLQWTLDGIEEGNFGSWEDPEEPPAARPHNAEETLELAKDAVRTLVRELYNREGDLRLTKVADPLATHPAQGLVWDAVLAYLAARPELAEKVSSVTDFPVRAAVDGLLRLPARARSFLKFPKGGASTYRLQELSTKGSMTGAPLLAEPSLPGNVPDMQDILVPGVRIDDIVAQPLFTKNRRLAAVAFPLSDEESEVFEEAFRNGAALSDGHSVLPHHGTAGFRVAAKDGRTVPLDASAMLRLFLATSRKFGMEWRQGATLEWLTCPKATPEALDRLGRLRRSIESLRYRGKVWFPPAPRIEVLRDGRKRLLANGEAATPGGVVMRTPGQPMPGVGTAAANPVPAAPDTVLNMSFAPDSLGMAVTTDLADYAVWQATRRAMPASLVAGVFDDPFVVYVKADHRGLVVTGADLAQRVRRMASYRAAVAVRPNLPVVVVAATTSVPDHRQLSETFAEFADALRGAGPHQEIAAATGQGSVPLPAEYFRRATAPRLEDLKFADLTDADGGGFGLSFAPAERTRNSNRWAAVKSTKFAQRVLAEFDPYAPNDGTENDGYFANWADSTEDGRARPLHLLFEVDADGDYLVESKHRGVYSVPPRAMARLVARTEMMQRAVSGPVRRRLLVVTKCSEPDRVANPNPAFVAELTRLLGPWQSDPYFGPAKLRKFDGVLAVERGRSFTERSYALSDLDYVSDGSVFGFLGGSVTPEVFAAVQRATAAGQFDVGGAAPRRPVVVVMDGKSTHASIGVKGRNQVAELSGTLSGRAMLQDPAFVAALKTGRPVLLVSGNAAERVNIGDFGFDFSGVLHTAGFFQPVSAPTGGVRMAGGRMVLEPGSAFALVSVLRAGDLTLSALEGLPHPDANRVVRARVIRSKDDRHAFGQLEAWLAQTTAESLKKFRRANGREATTPFRKTPVIIALRRAADGQCLAVRSDGRELAGSLVNVLQGLRDDRLLRGIAGTDVDKPLLVLSLDSAPLDPAAVARALSPGGYARQVFTAYGLDLSRPGILGAEGFYRASRIMPAPDASVTYPHVVHNGRAAGQMFPQNPLMAVTDYLSVRIALNSGLRHYLRSNGAFDTDGNPAADDIVIPWHPDVWQIDGHGLPGELHFSMRTGDRYVYGDYVPHGGGAAAKAVFLSDPFLRAAPRPGVGILLGQCFANVAKPGQLSVAYQFAGAWQSIRPDDVYGATAEVSQTYTGERTVEDGGRYEKAQLKPEVKVAVPGVVAPSDLLVGDIRISDVEWIPLTRPSGEFGMAFPLNDYAKSVMAAFDPDSHPLSKDAYSLMLEHGRDGLLVKAKGRVVALDEFATAKLFIGLGVFTNQASRRSRGVALLTCPWWSPAAARRMWRLPAILRARGYDRLLEPPKSPRLELLPDGTLRDLPDGATPAKGSVVLGPPSQASAMLAPSPRSLPAAQNFAHAENQVLNLDFGPGPLGAAVTPDLADFVGWRAVRTAMAPKLIPGLIENPYVVFVKADASGLAVDGRDLAERVWRMRSYRSEIAARPDLPVALVVVGSVITEEINEAVGEFIAALRGAGPYQEVAVTGIPQTPPGVPSGFKRVVVPRLEDMEFDDLTDADGADFGLILVAEKTVRAMAVKAAARSTQYSQRVIAEFEPAVPTDLLDHSAGRFADWAATTEDGRARPLHLFLAATADGRYVIGNKYGPGYCSVAPKVLARLVAGTAMIRRALLGPVRRPLVVLTTPMDPGSAIDPTPAFLAELFRLTGPWLYVPYFGPAVLRWHDGVLGVKPGTELVEHPYRLADLEYLSQDLVFGFAGGSVTPAAFHEVAKASAAGKFDLPGGGSPVVLLLDGSSTHAVAEVRRTGQVAELSGRHIIKPMLEDPAFVAAVVAAVRSYRPLLVLSPGSAERVDFGGFAFDLVGALHAEGYFPDAYAPTGGFRADARGLLLGRDSALEQVSRLRAGDLTVSKLEGPPHQDPNQIVRALLVRASGDAQFAAVFTKWMAKATRRSLKRFRRPDGSTEHTPFGDTPVIIALQNAADGNFLAMRSDGEAVAGPLEAVLSVLRDDRPLRTIAGTEVWKPLLVLSPGRMPIDPSAVTRGLTAGGYARVVYTAMGLDLSKPGLLIAEGFSTAYPAMPLPDALISHAHVDKNGISRGQFFPKYPLMAAMDSTAVRTALESGDAYYSQPTGRLDAAGNPVEIDVPVPWDPDAWLVDGHGRPGELYFTMRTGDPYTYGDYVPHGGAAAAKAIFLSDLFLSAQPDPRIGLVLGQCFGNAAKPGSVSAGYRLLEAWEKHVSRGRVYGADTRATLASLGRRGVAARGSFAEVKLDPADRPAVPGAIALSDILIDGIRFGDVDRIVLADASGPYATAFPVNAAQDSVMRRFVPPRRDAYYTLFEHSRDGFLVKAKGWVLTLGEYDKARLFVALGLFSDPAWQRPGGLVLLTCPLWTAAAKRRMRRLPAIVKLLGYRGPVTHPDTPWVEVRSDGTIREISHGDTTSPGSIVLGSALAGKRYEELTADGRDYGLCVPPGAAPEVSANAKRMAENSVKFSRRLVARYDLTLGPPRVGRLDRRDLEAAGWAAWTEDERAQPVHLLLYLADDGSFSVFDETAGAPATVEPVEMARGVADTDVMRRAAAADVRGPLIVVLSTASTAGNPPDRSEEFLAELEALTGGWQVHLFYGAALFWEDLGLIGHAPSEEFREIGLRPKDVVASVSRDVFGLVSTALSAADVQAIGDAVRRGGFERAGLAGAADPFVVVLDGAATHAKAELVPGSQVPAGRHAELSGAEVANLLLASPDVQAAIRLGRPLVLWSAEAAARPKPGQLGQDLVGQLQRSGHFPEVFAMTRGWWMDRGWETAGGVPSLAQGSAFVRLPGMQSGSLAVGNLVGGHPSVKGMLVDPGPGAAVPGAIFHAWFSSVTPASLRRYTTPDGTVAPTPFGAGPLPVVLAIWRDPRRNYLALRRDNSQAVGSLSGLLAGVLRQDKNLRRMAGSSGNIGLLVLMLGGDTSVQELGDFAQQLASGGYSRTVHATRGTVLLPNGALGATGFDTVPAPDATALVSCPIERQGRVVGQIFPVDLLQTIRNYQFGRMFAGSAQDRYGRYVTDRDANGNLVVTHLGQVPASWGRDPWLLAGHGVPGHFFAAMETGVPYLLGDVVRPSGGQLAMAVFLSDIFLDAAPGPQTQNLLIHCFGDAPDPRTGRSSAYMFKLTWERLLRPGPVHAAPREVMSSSAGELAVDNEFFRPVTLDPADRIGFPGSVSPADLMVEGVPFGAVLAMPLMQGPELRGTGFPISGREASVLRDAYGNGAGRAGVHAWVVHLEESGFPVQLAGGVVAVDEFAQARLMVMLGRRPDGSWHWPSRLVVLSCRRGTFDGDQRFRRLFGLLRAFGYPGSIEFPTLPRVEINRDGRVRELTDDEIPAPDSMVTGSSDGTSGNEPAGTPDPMESPENAGRSLSGAGGRLAPSSPLAGKRYEELSADGKDYGLIVPPLAAPALPMQKFADMSSKHSRRLIARFDPSLGSHRVGYQDRRDMELAGWAPWTEDGRAQPVHLLLYVTDDGTFSTFDETAGGPAWAEPEDMARGIATTGLMQRLARAAVRGPLVVVLDTHFAVGPVTDRSGEFLSELVKLTGPWQIHLLAGEVTFWDDLGVIGLTPQGTTREIGLKPADLATVSTRDIFGVRSSSLSAEHIETIGDAVRSGRFARAGLDGVEDPFVVVLDGAATH
ncbi:hypothetical protein, partial [Amycolatopsis sp. NPDC000740]